MREPLEAREHGDQLKDVRMLAREVTVVNNLQCWQETYLGKPLSRPNTV